MSEKTGRTLTVWSGSDSGDSIPNAEKLLEQVPESTYQVTKIFLPWNNKKSRVIKLSSKGIENVKQNQTTSIHKYEHVKLITMKDIHTLVIQ